MKFICLLFTLVSVLPAAAQGARTNPAAPYGFRDATFEAPLASFPGMAPVASSQPRTGHTAYTRRGDRLSHGAVPLRAIRYEFYNKKLLSVCLEAEGAGNGIRLRKALERSYGPRQNDPTDSEWQGQQVALQCTDRDGVVYIRLTSLKMRKELNYHYKREAERRMQEAANW